MTARSLEAPAARRFADARILLPVLIAVFTAVAYRNIAGSEAPPSANTVEGAEGLLFSPSDSSPLLIYAATLWILWSRRRRIAATLGAPAWPAPASLLLAAALALCGWSHYVSAPDLLVPSLSLLLLGGGALLGGRPALRVLLLPALFLLFAMPIPPVLVNAIIYPLQLLTAKLTTLALEVLQIPVLMHGDRLVTEARVFQVIESCSGLRLMETLTMSAVLFAELMYRNRVQVVCLVLAAPLIGVLVNAARVLSIVLNPYSEFSSVHTTQGIVMLIGGVLLLYALDVGLGRVVPEQAPPPEPPPPAAAPGPGRLAILAGALGLLAAATLAAPVWRPAPPVARTLHDLPSRLAGWRSEGIDVDGMFLGSVDFSERIHRRFQRDGAVVDVFVGVDTRLDRHHSLRSDKTMLPGSGWDVAEHGSVALEPDGRTANALLVRSPREGERLVVHWYDGVESLGVEALRSLLALDRGPLRREGRSMVVRLSAPVGDSVTARGAASLQIQRFVPVLREALAALDAGRLPGRPTAARDAGERGPEAAAPAGLGS